MSEHTARLWKERPESYSVKSCTNDTLQTSLNNSVIHLLHRASQTAGELFAEEMNAEKLTPRQFAVLLMTSQNEGISQTGLVKKTGIDRSTLADIIRRMQKKNLLERIRDKRDARIFSVRTTEYGRQVLDAALPAAYRADEHILNSIPTEKRHQLVELLELISGQSIDK